MPEVIFNGADGRLEGRYHHNENENAPKGFALLQAVLKAHDLYPNLTEKLVNITTSEEHLPPLIDWCTNVSTTERAFRPNLS